MFMSIFLLKTLGLALSLARIALTLEVYSALRVLSVISWSMRSPSIASLRSLAIIPPKWSLAFSIVRDLSLVSIPISRRACWA